VFEFHALFVLARFVLLSCAAAGVGGTQRQVGKNELWQPFKDDMTMTKVRILFTTAAVLTMGSSSAMAELSANVGFASDYIFRGVFQEDSSPSAGLDFETNGFYIGTWGADVGDGLEYDVYFGYGGGNDNFGWSVGYTAYRYTEASFDDDYDEINLGISAGGFALDVAIGEYANGMDPEVDYTYAGVSYTLESGTSFLIAQTDVDGVPGDPDSDGIWFEVSHGWEVANDIEIAATFLYSPDGDDPLSTISLSEDGMAEHAIVFSISKSIGITD
jgi:hypothetical protein